MLRYAEEIRTNFTVPKTEPYRAKRLRGSTMNTPYTEAIQEMLTSWAAL